MILSDKMIKKAVVAGDIFIDPFDLKCLGSNSYDVHLGDTLKTYMAYEYGHPLDCSVEQKTITHFIGRSGMILKPGRLYLGVTKEYTKTEKYVPFLDGKSSVGRLGISIHCTAGRGDVGFANHWTMEIFVQEPIRIYAGMPIGQLTYFETGEVDVPYNQKSSAKYNERCNEPQSSQMWRNFGFKK